jgi:hypothetical protein
MVLQKAAGRLVRPTALYPAVVLLSSFINPYIQTTTPRKQEIVPSWRRSYYIVLSKSLPRRKSGLAQGSFAFKSLLSSPRINLLTSSNAAYCDGPPIFEGIYIQNAGRQPEGFRVKCLVDQRPSTSSRD